MAETTTTTLEAPRAKRKERVGEVISNKMTKTTAVNVYWEKAAGTGPTTSSKSDDGVVDTWKDDPTDKTGSEHGTEKAAPSAGRKSEDGPPRLQRAGATAAEAPISPAADDPGPPKLKRGGVADPSRERAQDVAEQSSGLRFRRPIALVEPDLFARRGGLSGWIRWRFHLRLKLAVIHLAGAELRNLLHRFYPARPAQIRQPLRFDGVADFVQGQLRFVGHGDERFAFVFLGARDDGDLAVQAILRKTKAKRSSP